MKNLAREDRPREKLRRLGALALGDNELVALVIGNGSRRAGALAVANELLAAHGGLYGLTRAGIDELTRVDGIGRARAAQIVAALELGRRTFASPSTERIQMKDPKQAAEYLLPRFGSGDVERLGIALLDAKLRVLRTTVIVSGTLDTLVVTPREVFREATRGGAAAIVVFHNHPSGDPTPSPDDVELTRRLAASGTLLGIEVVDHVILGEMRYYSFKEAGFF
jgi:DNA repair protein RadC